MVGFGIAVVVSGCASVPPPTDRLARSEGSIRGAAEVGAQGVPAASLYLKLAQEELQAGKALMQQGDNERATYVLLRAHADAELALNIARENQAKTGAAKANEKMQKFQQTGTP
jgi:hypothetical protein